MARSAGQRRLQSSDKTQKFSRFWLKSNGFFGRGLALEAAISHDLSLLRPTLRLAPRRFERASSPHFGRDNSHLKTRVFSLFPFCFSLENPRFRVRFGARLSDFGAPAGLFVFMAPEFSSQGAQISPEMPLLKQWFSNVFPDLLSGFVVALALIPEAIAFSFIAGVDPKIGLYGAFMLALSTAIFGGRIGMISAATAAVAVFFTGLVKNHGVEYLFAATILIGVLQGIFGVLGLGKWIAHVPKAVMSGFLNALGILVFLAQLRQFEDAGAAMFVLLALGLLIIYVLPRFTKAVPSSLVAIGVVTALALAFRLDLNTVGDVGKLPDSLPLFGIPSVPPTLETLWIILPVALGASVVGLLESLLTAQVLDEMTGTPSDKNRECRAQGLGNVITGFFGGMGGCAMIGQSVINIKNGGRGRLSSFAAGAFLLAFMLLAGDWVSQIPMVALVGVMFMVAATTFDWSSVKSLRITPKGEVLVMVVTVAAVLISHNLAIGVGVGIGLWLARSYVWHGAKRRLASP